MKISYKYLSIVILAVLILSPFKNTFARVTCGNGDTPSCASCGSSLYTRKLVPGGCDLVGNGSKIEPCWDVIYAGTCSKVACGGSCTNRYAQMITSAPTIKNFYENYYTGILPKWSDSAVSLTLGSKGLPVSSLSIILEGFGFGLPIANNDTGAVIISNSYESEIIRAVIGLQKALKLPISGNFDPITREAFATFYYDISSILISPAEDTTKLAIVYPGGVTSFFNGSKFDKPLLANSFIVTQTTFIMQDSAGKNFLWKNDKWNATTTAFPTPKVSTPTGLPIKGSISTFSTKLSGIISNVTSNISSTTRVANGMPSTIVPNIANILNFLGFSSYVPTANDRNFGPTSIAATRALDASFGLTADDTFDSVEAKAVNDFNSTFSSAVNTLPSDVTNFNIYFRSNKSMSIFNATTGVFNYTPAPFNPPAPNCDGVKQPPCVGLLRFKCCDADGENCIGAGSFGGVNTCSGDGKGVCAANEDGKNNCRDVF